MADAVGIAAHTVTASIERPAAAAISDAGLSSDAASSAPFLFKKKRHKQGALRKPLSSAIKDEEDVEDKTDHTDKALEETRLLQRFRAKQHSAAVNSDISALLSIAADNSQSHRAATKLTTIGATFQAEEETTDVVEEKMRQYIEEQLDKRRRDSSDAKRPREEVQASSQSAEVESADEQSSEAAVLHDVAPLLRRKAVLDEKEEESAERWLRGIAEVQLPMEHRMNNVERTEAARARVTQTQQSSMLTQPPSALPANYNSNFAMHKSEWDGAMREQWRQHTEAMERHREEQRAKGIKVEEPKERGRGRGRGGGGGGGGPDAASDSRVVDRFIKRFKAK